MKAIIALSHLHAFGVWTTWEFSRCVSQRRVSERPRAAKHAGGRVAGGRN